VPTRFSGEDGNEIGERIAESYGLQPQSAEEETFAMSNAFAMTEAESW